MKEKELRALKTLLEDPDKDVFQVIENQLTEKGIDVVPELEKVWKESSSALLHQRVENIIDSIHFNDIQGNFSSWLQFNRNDLLLGSYYVSRFQYPELDFADLNKKIQPIINDVKKEMSPFLTNLEKIKVLNHIMFDVQKFTGNTLNFYSPQNCFINHVLDTKKGNTISLGIIYEIIGHSLDLPIYAVNLPPNLILAFLDKKINTEKDSNQSYNVLFYVNPFNKGAVLGKKEIDFFLEQQKLEKKISYYIPCKNTIVIKRLINNLVFAFDRIGYKDKIEELKKIEKLLSEA